jgi:HEAT repeat protein
LACIRRLAEAGPKAKPALGELIKILQTEPCSDLRLAILNSLVAISPGDMAVTNALIASFSDHDHDVFYAAVGHISSSIDQKAVLALAAALESKDKNKRRGASLSLVCFQGDISAAIPALRKALADPGEKVNAAHALSKLGPKALPALSELVQLLSDSEAGTNAAHALGGIGQPAVPYLVKSIEDKNSTVRERSALALFAMGPQARDAIPALERACKDTNIGVRVWATEALEAIRADKER